MPRKPKISSPMRELRLALGKTQTQFGRMFGISRIYAQSIELGQRPMPDDLGDEIELKFGLRPGALKQKKGMPVVWLFQERTVVVLPQRISEPILKELRKLRDQPRERLRYQIDRWQKMLPAMEKNAPRNEVVDKLLMLLDAAASEQKQLSALWRLDRWIENQIASLKLREPIRIVAQKRGKRGALGTKPLTLPLGSLIEKPARLKTSVVPPSRYKAVGSA
jgi:transcriptional regulator with XRE-family HTH domain